MIAFLFFQMWYIAAHQASLQVTKSHSKTTTFEIIGIHSTSFNHHQSISDIKSTHDILPDSFGEGAKKKDMVSIFYISITQNTFTISIKTPMYHGWKLIFHC